MPVREIVLDASGWREPADFWAPLIAALGAPDWHGHNLDALYDSLVARLNAVAPPYVVIVRAAGDLPPALGDYLARVERVFADARTEHGVDARLRIDA